MVHSRLKNSPSPLTQTVLCDWPIKSLFSPQCAIKVSCFDVLTATKSASGGRAAQSSGLLYIIASVLCLISRIEHRFFHRVPPARRFLTS